MLARLPPRITTSSDPSALPTFSRLPARAARMSAVEPSVEIHGQPPAWVALARSRFTYSANSSRSASGSARAPSVLRASAPPAAFLLGRFMLLRLRSSEFLDRDPFHRDHEARPV